MESLKLHSKGGNGEWFHFRRDIRSIMQSFTVTYCKDGTVCMTGDMGCLCFQREWFPEVPDYGFPFENTGIGYFAEKVVRANDAQIIKGWSKEKATRDIQEAIAEYKLEGDRGTDIEALESILENLSYFEGNEYGHVQMLEAFGGLKHNMESETTYGFGMDYTEQFKLRYELLKSVSGMIRDAAKVL